MFIRTVMAVLFLSISAAALTQGTTEFVSEPFVRQDRSETMLSASEIRDFWKAIALAIAQTGQEATATQLEQSVDAIPDEDLVRIYGRSDVESLINVFSAGENAIESIDLIQGINSKSLRDKLASLGKGTSTVDASENPVSTIMSSGFPDATGYPGGACPSSPNRTDPNLLLQAVDDVEDARLALEIAQGIWSPLSRACDEIIVVLGEGFNTSLACIPVDIALFAAELVIGEAESEVEHMWHCNDTVNSAEIEGTYDRTGHLHTDLVNHDIDISNQLTQHDIDISAQLAQHDADIKVLLATLQETVEENQRLIKISMSRQLQIMRLLITPEGLRTIDPAVFSCTGDDCPDVFDCPTGDYSWNGCK